MYTKLSLLIILGNFPLFLMKNAIENHHVLNDTPSPEWIKYQQERYDPKYNMPAASPETTTTEDHLVNNEAKKPANSGHRQKVALGTAKDKLNTAPRKSSVNNHKQADENVQEMYEYVDVEDDNQDDGQQDSAKGDTGDANTNNLKYPSIPGFIEFLKSLQKTWTKKSLFRIDDKIKFLYNLKDSLMRAIEQQFITLWPDDEDNDVDDNREAQGRHLRHKRGILEPSNIDFPPEAALMSINFLTFAVFLIKLVLQVVNIIKSKHVQISSLGFNANSFTKG